MSRLWVRIAIGAIALAATLLIGVATLVLGPVRAAAAHGAPAVAVVAPLERGLLLVSVSAVIAGTGWALWSGLIGAREIRLARAAVERLARGDLRAAPVPATAVARDRLLGEIERLRVELERAAAAQAVVVGTVAHDLRGPLAGIGVAAERMARQDDRGQREVTGTTIRREIERATGIADEVLALCREATRPDRVMPIGLLLEDVAARVGDGAGRIAITAESSVGAVLCDDAVVVRAVGNLTDNALRHTGSAEPVRIRAAAVDDGVEISVEDDGDGFEPDVLTTPFAQGTGVTGSAGLGLASVARSLAAAGGGVRFERIDGGGMRAIVRMPSADSRR